jgi:hypothetical protein
VRSWPSVGYPLSGGLVVAGLRTVRHAFPASFLVLLLVIRLFPDSVWPLELTTTGQDSFPRVCLPVWDDHMLGIVACLFGVHHWSEWTPVDLEDPSKQVRACTRCSRVKFNNGPVAFSWNYPIE